MAKVCPHCSYTDDDWSADCPICLRPLLAERNVRKGRGGSLGSPDNWYGRRLLATRVANVILVVFAVTMIVWWTYVLVKNL